MNKEYIERGALLEKRHNVCEYDGKVVSRVVYQAVPVKDIQQAPIADMMEVKHGQWLKYITDELHEVWCDKCSICGFELDDLITAEGYNYCPNCGAKMDGENNG